MPLREELLKLAHEYPIGLGSAGFGWGGQAAVSYLKELKDLQGISNTIKGHLSEFRPVLTRLKARESSMADKLEDLVLQIDVANDMLARYLVAQLAHR
jgi:hypothetical protein